MSKSKLFLLDGHALVYRAHYAFITRPLINSKGWNTSAINGFVRMLWDLIRKEKPSHIAVAFDLPTPTFRHVMYEPYKAHRDAQPEDITFALPYIKKILEAFKIPILTLDGYEADDVIGTIAKKAEKEDFQVFMMTPDKKEGVERGRDQPSSSQPVTMALICEFHLCPVVARYRWEIRNASIRKAPTVCKVATHCRLSPPRPQAAQSP